MWPPQPSPPTSRCLAYQADKASGSSALKNTPPMPCTRRGRSVMDRLLDGDVRGFCRKERGHVRHVPRPREWRQGFEERAAVALADQARVAQHQHAAVGLAADEPADALLQRDHGLRQLFVAEGI